MNRRNALKGSLVLGAGALLGGQLLTGCAAQPGSRNESASAPEPSSPTSASAAKVLVAFFSRPGENYHYGGRAQLEVGNTHVVADMIASAIAVDGYRIVAADPYPTSYEATVERNRQEQSDDARPAIAGPLPSVADYDTVLLGSPIWNVRPPMIMNTLADNVNLAGKQIFPFVTYAVSGLGNTVSEYERMYPQATMGEGLAVRGEEVAHAQEDVHAWLRRTGLIAA